MMNDTLKTIDQRRSTRIYKDEEIKAEDKQAIFDAIINAPTAGNMTLYNVINVTDQSLKDQLAILCDHQPFIAKGKLVLLFVSNPVRWYDSYNLINNTNLKPTLADYYLSMNDGVIAAENAVIAGESLNIGSCYIGDIVENIEKIKELFKLSKGVVPICLLVMGYKVDDKINPRPTRFLEKDVITENYFENNSLDCFKNKFSNLPEDKALEKAKNAVNRTFEFKMKSDFFKEMNRSMQIILDEFK